jgi:hypothetical protein
MFGLNLNHYMGSFIKEYFNQNGKRDGVIFSCKLWSLSRTVATGLLVNFALFVFSIQRKFRKR